MENDLQQKITTRLAELPEDVRQAIQSVQFSQAIQSIGAKHQLHVDQIGALGDETTLVMLGFADPGAFASTLAHSAGIALADAQSIAQEVSQEFFVPIRESMKQFMAAKSAPATTAPGSQAPHDDAKRTLAKAPPPVMPLTTATADVMLSQKTVTAPAKPGSYAVDPYREPIE